MSDLDAPRKEIESIDRQMAELFVRRMNCAKAIAQYKIENGLPVLDKSREKALIEKNVGYIEEAQYEPYYREMFNSILKISKKYQQKMMTNLKVAYSGIEGCFACITASKIFPSAQRVPYKNFEKAYEAVCKGECDFAVLPIENSYAGEVGQVSDLMYSGDLYINGVYELGVSQCLLGVKGSSVDSIKSVISHPQALEQCNEYIYDHKYQAISSENTAIAAKEVADRDDITVAAIASVDTAELYNLEILASDINKSNQNTTRFAVFSRTKQPVDQNDAGNSFVLLFTVNDEAGTLAKAVSIIGDYGFNMTVIRSRPVKVENWKYYFYTEIEGNIHSEKGEKMLEALAQECEVLKVIGSFKPNTRI